MLAGDVPAEANLIVNGDFETFTNDETRNRVNSFATARFYGSDLVPGWTVADGDGDGSQRINLLTFNNARGTIFDVDSTLGQDDRVYQDVEVAAGQQYLFSFDYFGPNQVSGVSEPASNEFEVYYNGELLGALDGTNKFRQASFVVTGAANDASGSTEAGDLVSARFEFRDGRSGDRGGDGRGSLIDAVSLVPVTERNVVNGGFENNDLTDGPNFAREDVDGFSLFAFADDTEDRVIQILSDEDSDGKFLNLNSSPDLIDQVFQNLRTEAGETYLVTFDVRVDPTSSSPADQLRVRFDNQYAATVVGNDQWQSHSILVEASSSLSRLTFREPGEDPGGGASPQIDNIQLFQVNAPVEDDSSGNVPFVDGNDPANSVPGDSNFFFSFDENSRVPTATVDVTADTGSVYIFTDSASDFDHLDIDFTNSDSSVISFTGASTFDTDGNFTVLDILDPNDEDLGITATEGRLFGVSFRDSPDFIRSGISPDLSETDAEFRSGADGFLLARIDYDIVGAGAVDLDFVLGSLGVASDDVGEVSVGFESGALTVLSEPNSDADNDPVEDTSEPNSTNGDVPVVDTSDPSDGLPGDSNFFFSFDENSRLPTATVDAATDTGSVYVFADSASDFDNFDVDFTNSDSSVISFTGATTFDTDDTFSAFSITDPSNPALGITATEGRLFGVSIGSSGISPALSEIDAEFRSGADGFLLARLDYDIIGAGTIDLDFVIGTLGVANNNEGRVSVGFESGSLTVLSEPISDVDEEGSDS